MQMQWWTRNNQNKFPEEKLNFDTKTTTGSNKHILWKYLETASKASNGSGTDSTKQILQEHWNSLCNHQPKQECPHINSDANQIKVWWNTHYVLRKEQSLANNFKMQNNNTLKSTDWKQRQFKQNWTITISISTADNLLMI